MARRKSLLGQFERDAYLASRTAGDARAASRGPGPLARRLVRRGATRALFRLFR